MNRQRSANLLDRYLQGMSAEFKRNPGVRGPRRTFRRLADRGIKTVADLTAAYPDLTRRGRAFAVWALGLMDDRRAVPLLVRASMNEPELRAQAATSLGLLGGRRAYNFAVRRLRELLCADAVDDRDLSAAAIAVVSMIGEFDRLLEDPAEPVLLLVDLLQRKELASWTRGYAAYGLGKILEFSDQRRRRWRIASRAILDALSDDDAYVRHEAAHTAGDMRLKAARTRLRKMVKLDKGSTLDGSVAREATGALYAIEHGQWPEWWWEKREPDSQMVDALA